jgi:AmmeMemoRadiSam system protein A
MTLSEETKSGLLSLARKSLETYLKEKKKLRKGLDYSPICEEKNGAFVTLHDKDGELRGCIGQIIGFKPLDETVAEMAVAAGTQDPRFYPLSLTELSGVSFEISVLSVPKAVKNVDEIEVGRHGLIMSQGHARGLLLPQVATEWGFDRTTFLEHTCVKAGLKKDAWKDQKTVIETFEAEVFGEKNEK